MHYKNGREAKLGDQIVMSDKHGNFVAGTVIRITAGATSCNAQLVPPGTTTQYVTLGDCLHVEDIREATIPDSSKPA